MVIVGGGFLQQEGGASKARQGARPNKKKKVMMEVKGGASNEDQRLRAGDDPCMPELHPSLSAMPVHNSHYEYTADGFHTGGQRTVPVGTVETVHVRRVPSTAAAYGGSRWKGVSAYGYSTNTCYES